MHLADSGFMAGNQHPMTFIEKLCALVPPPRANLVTYHGVLAPNATWRGRVVPDEVNANDMSKSPIY